MAQSKKELVLSAMDRREVERVPSGFWFHFLADEIHADAYADPRLEQTLLDGELRYIDGFQPDFVKIMTDGFFSYPNPVVQTARTAKELAKVQPLPDDHPFFTRQIAYAKEITKQYGNEVATFYNIFCAGTTVKFMQPGTLAEDEAFLAQLVQGGGEGCVRRHLRRSREAGTPYHRRGGRDGHLLQPAEPHWRGREPRGLRGGIRPRRKGDSARGKRREQLQYPPYLRLCGTPQRAGLVS